MCQCYDPRSMAYDPKQAEAFRTRQAWRLGMLDRRHQLGILEC